MWSSPIMTGRNTREKGGMKKSTGQTLRDAIRWLKVWQNTCALGVAFLSLLLWAHFRSRYVGGCDPFAYLSCARAFLGLESGLELGLSPVDYSALVPLCHALVDGEVVSMFPPGFSAIMAMFGTVGLEFYCTPVLGAASVVLIYLALIPGSGSRTSALVISILWAATPIVTWGSTQVMSDMPATVFVLLSYVLLSRGRERLSGVVLGLSLLVRPTNVLFLPALMWSARERGKLRSLILWFAAAASCLAVYIFVMFGGPSAVPYGINIHEIGPGVLTAKLSFFGRTTLAMIWPLLIPAAFAAVVRVRRSIPLLLWLFSFVLFLSAWKPSIGAWWEVRFLLPAYPAIFLLAGDGLGLAGRRLSARRPWVMRSMYVIAAVAFFATVYCMVRFSQEEGVYRTNFDESYYLDTLEMSKRLPENSLVGALDFTGPLRLYGGIESFSWRHPGAAELINHGIWNERQVFMIVNPRDLEGDAAMRLIMSNYHTEEVARLSRYPLSLYRIGPRYRGIDLSRYRRKMATMDFGSPLVREHLISGWGDNEGEGDSTWVWAIGIRSEISLVLKPGRDNLVRFRARPMNIPGNAQPQTITVRVNGVRLDRFELDPEPRIYMFEVPAVAAREKSVLSLEFAYAVSPRDLGISNDARKLAVLFHWLEAR